MQSVSYLFLLFVFISVKGDESPMKMVTLHGEKDVPYECPFSTEILLEGDETVAIKERRHFFQTDLVLIVVWSSPYILFRGRI